MGGIRVPQQACVCGRLTCLKAADACWGLERDDVGAGVVEVCFGGVQASFACHGG